MTLESSTPVRDLLRAGESRREPPAPPGLVACASVLAVVTFALRLGGLRLTTTVAHWFTERSRMGGSTARTCVPLIVHRVDLAGAFFPGRARCLERSYALHVCLGLCGIPTTVRLGVQPYPFAAHAWVELEGEPVGESPDSLALFTPLPLEGVECRSAVS